VTEGRGREGRRVEGREEWDAGPVGRQVPGARTGKIRTYGPAVMTTQCRPMYCTAHCDLTMVAVHV